VIGDIVCGAKNLTFVGDPFVTDGLHFVLIVAYDYSGTYHKEQQKCNFGDAEYCIFFHLLRELFNLWEKVVSRNISGKFAM
jgi:hypothetical protein